MSSAWDSALKVVKQRQYKHATRTNDSEVGDSIPAPAERPPTAPRQINTPTTHAVMQAASVPPIIARNPSRAKSPRREGAKGPMPPI